MLVANLFGYQSTTHIAGPRSASTSHLVAPILLDKFLATAGFRASSDLCIGNGFLDLETPLCLVLLFHFGALERNMSWLLTQLTHFVSTRCFRTMKNHLRFRDLGLNATLGTRTIMSKRGVTV